MATNRKVQSQERKPVNADASGVAAVEQYLAALAEPARTTLITVRERIRASAPPEATEGFGYGVPAFRCEALLAGYAAGKKFCSYYPMSGRVIHDLQEQLKDYTTTSGAIHFPLDKPLSAPLIKKLVHARLKQIRDSR
jgi:uncharacterized protein YdhG (YjbR/CyaY superfamily)